MTIDEYVRALAEAITREEDLSDRETRDTLYELALRIYALLLRELPTTRFERYMAWPQLRRQIVVWMLDVSEQLRQNLYTRITSVEGLVQAPVTTFFRLAPEALPPRPLPELVRSTTVSGTSVERLFAPAPRTGIPPMVSQLLQLLERSVMALFFQDATTPEVAQRVIGVRSRAGRDVPVPSKGTVANAWRERNRSITAAALWGVVNPTQERAAQVLGAAAVEPIPAGGTAPPAQVLQWRWNAVLDPKTCPVCRPLHNTVAATPQAFSGGPPPRHPRCRCIAIPEFV